MQKTNGNVYSEATGAITELAVLEEVNLQVDIIRK